MVLIDTYLLQLLCTLDHSVCVIPLGGHILDYHQLDTWIEVLDELPEGLPSLGTGHNFGDNSAELHRRSVLGLTRPHQ